VLCGVEAAFVPRGWKKRALAPAVFSDEVDPYISVAVSRNSSEVR
jgi:hypothetical protein